MKNSILSFFILFSVNLFAQEGINFENIPYKELLAKAKKENKIVFIDAMASWCGPCKMMANNVFPKKTVGDYYNKNFVNAQIDMEKGEGREIASQFSVRSYPTYLFINGDGQLISRNVGYMPEKTFIELGKEAVGTVTGKGTVKERFAKGEKDPDFLINIIKLNANTDYEFAKQASERYFQNKTNKEFTKDEVSYLLYFVKSVDDPGYAVFQKNKIEIAQVITEKVCEDFDNQLKVTKLLEQSIDHKTKTINESFFLQKAAPLIGQAQAESYLHKYELSYYQEQQNFPAFEKTALAYYQNLEKVDPTELLNAAWIFLDKAKNKNSILKAQEWAETVVMKGENAENTYILAKFYQKTGKIAEAKMYANASMEFANKSGSDATLAENLLKELQ